MFSQRVRPSLGWLSMAAGALMRILVGLIFVSYVVASLVPSDTARILQLLFLQGGLTALLSASAYARGASLASQGAPLGPMFRQFLRFVVLTTLAAGALGAATVPAPGPHASVIVFAMVLGAAGSAVNGLVQGVVMVRAGGVAAFLPSVVVNALGIVAIAAAWGSDSPLSATLLWVGPMLLAPAVLVLLRRSVLRDGSRDVTEAPPTNSGFPAIGALNAGSVGIAYVFRERWALNQPEAVAADGFAVVRVTELFYQVVYMVVASMPGMLNRHFTSRAQSPRGRVWLLMSGAFAVALGSLPAVVFTSWSVELFIWAEVLVMPSRLVTTACFLALLGQPTTKAYQVTMAATLVVTAATVTTTAVHESQYALQLFQCLAAAVAVLGTATAFKRSETTTRRC